MNVGDLTLELLLDKTRDLHRYRTKFGHWSASMTDEEFELVEELYRRADKAYGRTKPTKIAFESRVYVRRDKGANPD